MKLPVGTRVRLNDVAPAFVGQIGTVTAHHRSMAAEGELNVVKLDTPTAPAKNWPPLETLGVQSERVEIIQNP